MRFTLRSQRAQSTKGNTQASRWLWIPRECMSWILRLSTKDRDDVQTRMLSAEVLDTNRFPQIRFESTTVDRLDHGGWMVRGQLTLHGESRPVVVKVSGEHGHYTGSTSVKQTDFGVAPISIAGGTVKVKDEVRIEFDVWTRAIPRDAR